jgi:DNA-directed RNA polymerase subunit beta'
VLTADPQKQFEELKEKLLTQISSTFPIPDRTGGMEVRVRDLNVKEGLGTDDIQGQYDHKTKGKTWVAPVHGTLDVVDTKTGKVLSSREGVRVADIPKLTRHYSYIIGGQEKQVANQWRLKPGAYVKPTQKEGVFEAQFQLAKGHSFDVSLDPATGYMAMVMGTRKIPLYSVLRQSGMKDKDLAKMWSPEVLEANRKKSKGDTDIRSLYRMAMGKDAPTDAPPKALLSAVFQNTKMDPEVTKETLGAAMSQVSGDALARASHKLLRVSRKEQKPDVIDSLKFKELWTAADQFTDRLERSKNEIHRRVQNAMGKPKTRAALLSGDPKAMRDAIPTDLFRKPIHHVFGTALASSPDQTNPVSMLSGNSLVTITGPGGITNPNAITYENTAIDPSQLGFVDPVHTPEQEAGKNLHLTVGTEIANKKPKMLLYNLKTGKQEKVSPQKAAGSSIVLPDQVKWQKGKPVPLEKTVRVNDSNGEIKDVEMGKAQYVMPSPAQMFSVGTNMVPFMQNDSAHRSTMSARHMEQAISIDGREPPRVQVGLTKDKTFEQMVGSGFLAHRTPTDGVVKSVKPGKIVVQGKDGKAHTVQTYDHYPLNDAKAMIHSEPLVKPGDRVKKNQPLADNNFTKEGTLALGTNLRTAYIANGANHEDGIVVSHSAAKKLGSTHLHKPSMEVSDTHILDKKRFVAQKGTVYKPEQYEKVGPDGVVHEGAKLKQGDPMVLALGVRQSPDSIDAVYRKRLGRSAKEPFTNSALTWNEEHDGEVVKVHKQGKKVTVHVKTKEPAVVGSKLSTRHSAKGIVADILPDGEMPRDKKGKPVDMLLNPVSVPGRMNPGQILETVAGKISEKTGKPYVVKNFEPGKDYLSSLRKELKDHKIPETETLYDPKTGRKLGDVTVGPHYAFQLKHQIDKKTSVRGGGGYIRQSDMPKIHYDDNQLPKGGGHTGAQALSSLGIYAALASGLQDNLREMQTLKSDQKQAEEVWGALNKGDLLPPPQVPFVFDKFRSYMDAMGVNMVKEGNSFRLMPRTDKEVKALAGKNGEITKPNLAVTAKNMKEEKGGIFDPNKTGGKGGHRWSYIKLTEPMPNPVFAPSIARLLNIKETDIPSIVEGKTSLGKYGKGAEAIHAALGDIDVGSALKKAKQELSDPKLKGSALDKTHERVKSLQMLEKNKQSPVDAYTMKNVPVLPPVFRPMSELPGGRLHIDPMNQLYRRLGMLNTSIKQNEKAGIPKPSTRTDRAALYREMQNLFGTTPKSKKAMDIDFSGREVARRPLSGVLHTLGGEHPKDSFFQKKVINKKQDFTARATIVADPGLGIDEVALPKKVAFELYRPMVARKLQQTGKFSGKPIEAHKEISERTPYAEAVLKKELEDRPVLLKRDPVLHQYGIVGQKVKLTKSPAVKVSPLVLPPIGGDIDGDTVSVMVPLSREAKEEAKQVMPSQRPIGAASGDVLFQPTNEASLALYRASIPRGEKKVTFMDVKSAENAFKENKIDLNTKVRIGKNATTLGRARIAGLVPEKYKSEVLTGLDKPFTKDRLATILKDTARETPERFERLATGVSRLGFKMAYESGHSVTLSDLDPLRKIRNRIITTTQKQVDKIKGPDAEAKKSEAWQKATLRIRDSYSKYYDKHPTNISDMAKGKIKAKPLQFQGLVMAPMLMQDHLGRPSKVPAKKSFAEGLDLGSYWLQSSGARRGAIQKTDAVSEPGHVTKLLVQGGIDQPIGAKDCETSQGMMMSIKNKDIIDRHLASPVTVKGTTLPAGTVVTPDLPAKFAASKMKQVPVRSPLKCRLPQGVCAVCMGLHPTGKHYEEGDAVGVVAAQALGERATQLMLRQTHGGGLMPVEKKGVVDQFQEVQDLLFFRKRTPENAALASADGMVQKVSKAPQGGWNVHTTAKKRPFHSRHAPLVRTGQQFKKGEALTKGSPNVHDLLKTRGLDSVQDHMVRRIGDIYEGEGVLQRHVELAVRNATGLSRIDDPGDHPYFVRGDWVMKPVVDDVNRNVLKGRAPITAKPVLKSVIQAPQFGQKDWMGRLQTQQLSKHVQTGARHGQRADLHGPHPIPGLAYGAEFAIREDGKKGY